MTTITEDMRQLIEQVGLSFVATVCPDGTPNLSPKATLSVLDDEHLVFANIRSPQTVRNLDTNPNVEVNVVDVFRRRGYRFKGTAEVLDSGPLFEEITGELRERLGPRYPLKQIVKIKVERAAALLSPAYIYDDPRPTEEELKASFLRRYGVRELEPAETASVDN
jgi:predicted pyridoxine 5'-phosphate oxidase superfamily flavin-nucleotide-binding protein